MANQTIRIEQLGAVIGNMVEEYSVAVKERADQAGEKAVKKLAAEGISVDLIDLRTIVPLDTDTIIKSVKKTGKLLIVDEGHVSFGISGEIATRIMPEVFYDLEAPIERLGTADVPLPFSPALEFPLIPDDKKIAAKIREMVGAG